ncbi:MAG: CCA tRNA nucleotidyltransferase [Candidatus Diapherotrites archaeon]|nr:CCA tRNA nucleotidyltransferase [Candidatus Diapherotrites archaeon]
MKKISELKPTPRERKSELALAESIIGEIRGMGYDAMLVGSIAKNTCLRGDKDLDIFILFDKKVPRKMLEKKGLDIGKKVAKAFGSKAGTHYAEHPYTKMNIRGYDIDVVPCYDIKKGEKIISAVDRSPLHTEYILANLKSPDEARLLKHFAKRIEVYGAEVQTHGFSGYLCELLVLKYGTFRKVLERASRWESGEYINLAGHGKKKFREPLVVVDPVDPERNVAAAVSEQKLCEFILLSREFLKKGMPEKTSLLPSRGRVMVIEWKIGEENEEIIWSQLQRLEKKLVKQLHEKEFGVIDSRAWTDCCSKAQVLLELEVWELPPVNDHWGPRVYDRVHAEAFLKKYKKAAVRGNRIVTERRREYATAKALLKDLLKQPVTHLKRKKYRILEGSAAKKTQAWKDYRKKLWRLH